MANNNNNNLSESASGGKVSSDSGLQSTGENESGQEKINKNRSYTKKQKISLILCLTTQYFINVCASLPAPFLPKLNETHNIHSDITGWILGLLPLTQLLLCPLFGKLIGTVSLKTILVSGIFFCGGSTVLFGLLALMPVPDPSDKQVDTVYLILAIILRISQAMGSSAVFTAAMTCLTISFTEQTTTILSYSETVAGLGFMSGPAFGSGLYKAGGFLLVFTGVGGMLIVTSVVIGILLPEAGGSMDTGNSKSALKLLMHNLNILLALLLTAFIGTLWASIETILEPELRTKYGLTQDISALVFLILSVTYTITAPLVGKALDKLSCLNSLYVMVFGFLLHTVNFLFMGPSPMLGIERPLWLLLLTLGILGIALGLTIVPSLDLLSFSDTESENAEGNGGMDESSKALISGFWSSAYSFGDFFGPTFSGIVTRHGSFGLTMTYYAIGCFAVAVIIILCVFYRLFSKRCHSCISSSYRESNDERRQLLHPESVN